MPADRIPRKIIHIDMDAFFAAVEQRDNPELRGRPIIVGGRPDARGVVATCSYEARKFGVRSAMSSALAYRLCPEALFIKPRFEVYKEVSAAIRGIFAEYTDLIEPLSLDEAYLDVTEASQCRGSATWIAREIKEKIRLETGLTASAGISYNKFLAKIASDLDKPDGLCLITPEQGPQLIEGLAIGQFHGIGKATEKRMHELGIHTGRDLKQWPLASLVRHFGKAGHYYYDIARGIDDRAVRNYRPSKSVGVETTYQEDLDDPAVILEQLRLLLDRALARLALKQMSARTLTVKLKYHNFVQITRSRTLPYPITREENTDALLAGLLKDTEAGVKKVRLLGVALSSLQTAEPAEHRQLDLFNG
ncbi:DNA polymerase IV [Methylosarcina fibrata]|uniref:DNA polymerase IV n=1 Tax=Methylosarcina fibrata TaxID=105972 RepID=UPI0003619ED1|nr:DNA polymerase IV [Methylosarcina fibrata]